MTLNFKNKNIKVWNKNTVAEKKVRCEKCDISSSQYNTLNSYVFEIKARLLIVCENQFAVPILKL